MAWVSQLVVWESQWVLSVGCMGASGLVVWESQWVLSVVCTGDPVGALSW